jgi:hypothetical protein
MEAAEQLFNAYNEQGPNPWKTWDGKDVPRWDAINDQVRAKWRAVADVADKAVEAMRERKDGAYSERNKCVALLAKLAIKNGWTAGVTAHPPEDKNWEDDWRTIVFIDTPAGQVSWHFHDSEMDLIEGLPGYVGNWDGHDTPEKYRRVNAALR